MDGPAEDGGTVCGTINMAVCRNVTESTTTALHNTASGGRAAAAAEEPAEEPAAAPKKKAAKAAPELDPDAVPIGTVVWAKLQGFPWWPGLVARERVISKQSQALRAQGQTFIYFFGTNDYAWCKATNEWEAYKEKALKDVKKLPKKKLQDFNKAVDGAEEERANPTLGPAELAVEVDTSYVDAGVTGPIAAAFPMAAASSSADARP